LELFKFKKNYLFSVQLLQSIHNSPVVASEDVGHLGFEADHPSQRDSPKHE
ncbi:unnamed protein product, partial [Gulo gulo]